MLLWTFTASPLCIITVHLYSAPLMGNSSIYLKCKNSMCPQLFTFTLHHHCFLIKKFNSLLHYKAFWFSCEAVEFLEHDHNSQSNQKSSFTNHTITLVITPIKPDCCQTCWDCYIHMVACVFLYQPLY